MIGQTVGTRVKKLVDDGVIEKFSVDDNSSLNYILDEISTFANYQVSICFDKIK